MLAGQKAGGQVGQKKEEADRRGVEQRREGAGRTEERWDRWDRTKREADRRGVGQRREGCWPDRRAMGQNSEERG